MKMLSHHGVRLLALAGFMISAASAGAQDAQEGKKIKLVDFAGVKSAIQKTPDFTLKGGTTDKRWKPKDWIEIESTLKVEAPKNDAKMEVIPELVFTYHVLVGTGSAAKVLTGTVTHTNIPVKEAVHSVMYISPSALFKATGKADAAPTTVSMTGVEVTMGGDIVGQFTSGAPEWWKSPKAPKGDGGLLNKSETPFAPLWGDYHLDVKAK